MSINITKKTSYSNTTAYSNRPLKYIVIHYTAGSTSKTGTASNTASMFSNPNVYASADFIVDDTTVVQFNPDIKNRYCWHCGDNKNYTKGGSYYGKCQNYNSIGIEICSTNTNWSASDQANSSKWSYTTAVVNKAVKLVKYLMDKYGIPANNVIRHYDVTGKLCPGIIGWNEDSGDVSKWRDFKSRISENSANNKANISANTATSTSVIYRVRKSWSDTTSQIGAWKNLNSAKAQADKNKGYSVFDKKGKVVYTPNKTNNKSYKVKVTADVLNVRKGAGTIYAVTTTIKRNEVYTIVAEKNGWGKLKSGAGWICLDYTKRV